MGEAVTEPTPTPAPEPAAQPTDGATQPTEPVQDTTDWKAEARKWEQRAKDNQKAAKDLESQRKAAMTEAERAIAEAEERGRTAVRTEYGARLAQTEFRAAAAARNPGYDVAKALGYVDLSKFVGEDGEPDTKAIAAAVADLVPEGSTGPTPPPSFDGGTRQSAPAGVGMSQLIRQAAGRA
jgi:hypothetical protein